MGMTNTDGNLALVDSFATENAPIADRVCNGPSHPASGVLFTVSS